MKPRTRILVVEDESVVALDIQSQLEKLEYHVIGTAASGEEAICRASEGRPDLVLMDIRLKGALDGIAAASEIRTRLNIPVIYLTAYSDEETLDRARVTEPFGYLLKPFDQRELQVVIEMALYRHRIERALTESERRLDAILSSIGDAVIAYDEERRVTFLNPAAEALLGCRSANVVGRDVDTIVMVTRAEAGCAYLQDLRGRTVPVEETVAPISGARGMGGGVIALRNISERQRAQQEHEKLVREQAARAGVEKAHAQMQFVSRASESLMASLDGRQTTDAAVELVVPYLADWCVVHLREDDRICPVAARHISGKEALVREVDAGFDPGGSAPLGCHEVVRTGRSRLIEEVSGEDLERSARDATHLARLRELAIRSSMCVPLVVRGETIGAITFGASQTRRRYTVEDLALAEELTRRTAIAIENARLYRDVREANRRSETLLRIGTSLNAELDLQKLLQVLIDQGTALCRAQFGAFFYNVTDENGDRYMLYTLAGAARDAFGHMPMPRNTAIFGPTFNGEGAVRLADVTRDPRFGHNPPYHGMPPGHLPVRSYLALPVVARDGEVIGGLFFGHADVDVFEERDEQLLVAVTTQAATALENARLYEDERRARALAERTQQRTAKLHTITAALSRALDAEEAARLVIHETLPAVAATAGFVLVLDAAGKAIERLVDEDGRSTAELGPLTLASEVPACEAARTGKIVWLSTREEIARRDPRLVEVSDRLGIKTWGAIPLVFEGRTVGSLAFLHATEYHLSTDDQEFLLAVGQQCAQALERARLYEATLAARARAEAASNAKDEFLAMLGHELRNPLAPIVTALELMRLRGDVESTHEQRVIERQVQHLVRLVEDLLDVSRITRGKVRLEKRPLELGTIIARGVEMASPLLEQRRHRFRLDVAQQHMSVEADEARLSQVIANLLTNAAKYTEPGGNISLTAYRDGQELVIQVKDDGIGISPELLPRVFDPFVQGHRESDRGQGGLGIGLALVRNLVSMHSGSVVARSEGPYKGSEFVVRLPALDHGDAASAPATATASLDVTRTPRPQRVLIVDDNVDAAVLLAGVLRAAGHEVVVAHDAPHALAALEAFRPAIAILDIGLPVMDGYALAERIHEKLGAAMSPTLMALTGYGQDADRRRATQVGFARHFVKPVNAQELLAVIDATEAVDGVA
ncbi:PAS domain S-box-containing protein [Nannocystis exedens]|uniref:histidine kinase n=1 Tax=Nannocystis exedens TaxID=54 RepID=A0A1I2FIH6_9BACT|nr:GAF domain-containing protein [Nannocystis exedens]PCC70430.1 histidine kinase [Nannocystis exedens]SFF04420.1 PAS domain S-box-containing protein [Nannocystis exedens]